MFFVFSFCMFLVVFLHVFSFFCMFLVFFPCSSGTNDVRLCCLLQSLILVWFGRYGKALESRFRRDIRMGFWLYGMFYPLSSFSFCSMYFRQYSMKVSSHSISLINLFSNWKDGSIQNALLEFAPVGTLFLYNSKLYIGENNMVIGYLFFVK